MKKILVVEDSGMVLKILKHVLSKSDLIQPVYADTYATAQQAAADNPDEFFAAVVDLNLPDAPNGEVVDFSLGLKIPTIVLTGSFDADRRKLLLEKGVVDYVTKEGRFSYEYVLNLVVRLIKNQEIQVLVVDDSPVMRTYISELLKLHRYQVFETNDGVAAVKTILDNPGIRLLITDFNMPRMDGVELVQNLRCKYEKSDLVIIALSTESEDTLSARFIKSGANDFLRKPFNHEEFICRITHNVEMLEMIEAIRDAANRDSLTGAYNRYYFLERAEELLAQAQEKSVPVAAAVIELDNFKGIHHEYGHEVSDSLLSDVASRLAGPFNRFLFAHADGSQFFVLMVGLNNDKALAFVDKVRQLVGVVAAPCVEGVNVTFSAGVSNQIAEGVDRLLEEAEACLLRAQEAGGDLVFGDD